MASFLSADKGVPIRMPSVANLMIDSTDRDETFYPSPFDFQITKTNNLQNGYFTRISATEVVLEWCEPNVSAVFGNDVIAFDISGTGANAYVNANLSIALTDNFYTVAQALDSIVELLNLQSGTTGATFSISQGGRNTLLDCSGAVFRVLPDILSTELELTQDQDLTAYKIVGSCPDLRRFRYLDFVSEQLTYAQDVKDASTNPYNRNVLLRWYMAWDNPPSYDKYGFPILMGYSDFVARRLFNPPKQIKWDTNLPVGNLAFQVYNDAGQLITKANPANFLETAWLMTLQLSEV